MLIREFVLLAKIKTSRILPDLRYILKSAATLKEINVWLGGPIVSSLKKDKCHPVCGFIEAIIESKQLK